VWYTCSFVSTIWKALKHVNAPLMNVYTQPHTNAHATHKYMHVYSHTQHHTHTHVHTQHHVNAGWILSSLFCKPGGAWQNSGDSPSGWGYGRPTGQGWKLIFITMDKWCAFKLEQFCGTSCTFKMRISIDNLTSMHACVYTNLTQPLVYLTNNGAYILDPLQLFCMFSLCKHIPISIEY